MGVARSRLRDRARPGAASSKTKRTPGHVQHAVVLLDEQIVALDRLVIVGGRQATVIALSSVK
jgi:hypothetical protein